MILYKRAAPAVFALLGAIGFVVRRFEIETVFDPITGLGERWHVLSVLTTLLAAAAAVLAVCIGIKFKEHAGKNTGTRSIDWNGFELAAGLASAAMIAVGTVLYYEGLWYSTFKIKWLEDLFVGLCGIGTICITVLSLSGGGKDRGWLSRVTSSIIPLWLCIWMLYFYRYNAENPVLFSYLGECLGLMAAAVGTFYYAGYMYGIASPVKSMSLLLIGEYLCIVSLADQSEPDCILLLAGLALWMGALASALVIKPIKKQN